MTLFEKVTESPEALGAFLTSLSAVNTPWEEHFQRTVCPECERYGKDCGIACPHEDKRNNPTWWLTQETAKKKTAVWRGGRLVLEKEASADA